MTPVQTERVKELLIALVDQPREKRIEMLDASCGDDAMVRAEVERLLKLRDQMGSFLERPAIRITGQKSPDETVGLTLNGRYLLEAYLASGGFAQVYRARDTLLDRLVAVKVLHRGVLSETTVSHEIKALASIDHPGVVGVLDAGVVEDGRHFLVMRYVSGPTLREILAESARLPEAAVGRLALQLTEALEAAHRSDVLHLDLKPENIVICDQGTPRERAVVLDFGVGALMSGDRHGFTSLAVKGSPYRAPELHVGKPSRSSDYYSLGAVLFEALTGKRYEAHSPAPIPKPWRKALGRLLAQDPSRRFHSTSSIASALPGSGRRVATARVAAAALILMGIYFLWRQDRTPPPRMPLAVPFTTLEGEETHPAFSLDGNRVFFSWRRENQESDIYVRDVGCAEQRQLTTHPARETHPACCSRDGQLAFLRHIGRGQTALVVMPSTGGPDRVISMGRYNSIAWAPDGRSIAVAFPEGPDAPMKISLLNLQTRQWRILTEPLGETGEDLHPAFSPDGRSLAFVRRHSNAAQVYVLSIDADLYPVGPPRKLTPVHADIVTPQWSPDGRKILYVAGQSSRRGLWVVPANGSQPPRPIPEGGDSLDELAVARSRWRMVFARGQTDANIWRVDLDKPGGALVGTRPLISSTRNDGEPAISPDGRKIAFISDRSGDEQVWIAGYDGTGQNKLTSFQAADNLHLYWAPDSSALLVTGDFDGRHHSFLLSFPSGKISEIARGMYDIASGWSKDGKWLYFLPSRPGPMRLWKLSLQGGETAPVTESPGLIAIESFDKAAI